MRDYFKTVLTIIQKPIQFVLDFRENLKGSMKRSFQN